VYATCRKGSQSVARGRRLNYCLHLSVLDLCLAALTSYLTVATFATSENGVANMRTDSVLTFSSLNRKNTMHQRLVWRLRHVARGGRCAKL